MASRIQKQIFIGGIYILIAIVIAGGIYWSKYHPICSDGIQNGQEEGVDCGTIACGKACVAPIQALRVQSTEFVVASDGVIDTVVKIYNPNIDYGIDAGVYDLIFNDQNGVELKRVNNNSFYILPGQTKYLVRTAIIGIPTNLTMAIEIKNADWVKSVGTAETPFVVSQEALTSGANRSVYEAITTNNSNFDFDTVDINVVVRDSSGKLITTNVTNLQTVLSYTNRSIKVSWPFVLPADARIQTEVGTNIFNNANFLKTNGIQEKFQQYY